MFDLYTYVNGVAYSSMASDLVLNYLTLQDGYGDGVGRSVPKLKTLRNLRCNIT